MGVFTSFCTGLIHSAIFSLTAVYATKMNFDIFEYVVGSLFLDSFRCPGRPLEHRTIRVMSDFVQKLLRRPQLRRAGSSTPPLFRPDLKQGGKTQDSTRRRLKICSAFCVINAIFLRKSMKNQKKNLTQQKHCFA